VALKKPTEYFKKEDKLALNEEFHRVADTPANIIETSSNFSDTLDSYKVFSETLDSYRVNIERVNHISEKVDLISEEIQNLISKEDLDRAIMAQLLTVGQSIQEVQTKVKGLNEKNLSEIKSDVSNLTESVNSFLDNDVPKYKKLIVESEVRTDNRVRQFEENINKTLDGIGDILDVKYQELTESLEGINEKALSSVFEDFEKLELSLKKIQSEEIPKYKKFIIESEKKTETRLNDYDNKLSTTLTSFTENLNNTLDKLSLIEDNKNELISEVTQKFKELKELGSLISKEVETNVSYKEQIKEKVAGLEVNILLNEKHIKDQNKNLYEIEEDVKNALSKINFEEIERQNHKLGKKVKYLEEVFKKFDEKEILSENNFTEPPSVKNNDPLTPLDQNFVTLEQLQQHYRLFINRIQQQLSTLGGGGETRLKYLDDIVGIATNPAAYDGKFLRYNHPEKNFEFVTVEGGGGLIDIDNITTNSITILDSEPDTPFFNQPVTLQKSFTAITNTTNPTSIHKNVNVSDYSTIEYLIQATNGVSINTVKILSVNNGLNINSSVVSSASVGSTFVDFNINIDDGFIDLVATSNTNSTIIYNVSYLAITRPAIEFTLQTENNMIILTEDGNKIQTEVA
jgi:hypothetical protein